MEEVRRVIEQIDKDTAGSVAQARIVKLKSANATELSQFLTQALQSILTGQTATGLGQTGGGGATGQNAQQLRETKSVVLEFMAQDEMAQELVRSGLLTDVRVNADPRTNSLMISAPKQSMEFMIELVRVLDQPSSAVAEIKVFTLTNADAADAVELLETLFEEETTGQNTSAIGVQLAGATDAGSNLVPIKFSTDGRTNSVVAIGGADALRIVEAVLLRLDDNDARNRTSEVIKLRNNPAADLATSVNQYLQSQRDIAQIDPDRVSSSQLIEQEVIVTAEPLSNSLIISATPRYRAQIMQLIEDLDREPQQVAIQALLVEVTLQDNDEFGVELGFQDSILFDRSLLDTPQTITTTTTQNNVTTTAQQIISQSATPGFPFNNLPLGNNIATHPSKVGTQGLSSFSLGRTNQDLGYGGLVLSASSESVNVLIRALSARRNVRVLSRPSVTVLDNQIAEIQVGQIVPVTNGVTINNNNVIPTILRDNAGIILTVTPRISQDGQVVMVVAAEKSLYSGAGVTLLTDTNGRDVTAPIKDITTASTTVKVPDGQTIVMGGMITNSEDTSERKVPWLGDIPVIGQAFRFDSFEHRRTELLIFLTPRVIRCDEDAEQLKQIEAQRIHWFEDEAEQMHGPIFAVPGENSHWEAPATLTPRPELGSEIEIGTPTPLDETQPIQQMKAEQPARRTTTKPRGLFQKSR
jgi:type II secretion system protein D